MRPHLHNDEQEPEMERYRSRSYQIVIKIAKEKPTACREHRLKNCKVHIPTNALFIKLDKVF